jgi:hypothetical protein
LGSYIKTISKFRSTTILSSLNQMWEERERERDHVFRRNSKVKLLAIFTTHQIMFLLNTHTTSTSLSLGLCKFYFISSNHVSPQHPQTSTSLSLGLCKFYFISSNHVSPQHPQRPLHFPWVYAKFYFISSTSISCFFLFYVVIIFFYFCSPCHPW